MRKKRRSGARLREEETRGRATSARPRADVALGIGAVRQKKWVFHFDRAVRTRSPWVRAVTSVSEEKPHERGEGTHRDERPPQGLVRLLLEGLVGDEYLAVQRGASARGLLGALVAAARVGEARFRVRSGHRRVVGVARQKRQHLAGTHLGVAHGRAVALAARAVALSHHGGIRFRVSMRSTRRDEEWRRERHQPDFLHRRGCFFSAVTFPVFLLPPIPAPAGCQNPEMSKRRPRHETMFAASRLRRRRSGLLQGARSSTPKPGRRPSRRERPESSVRRPCSVAAARRCVRADSPTRAHPSPSRRDAKTRLLSFQTTTIAS